MLQVQQGAADSSLQASLAAASLQLAQVEHEVKTFASAAEFNSRVFEGYVMRKDGSTGRQPGSAQAVQEKTELELKEAQFKSKQELLQAQRDADSAEFEAQRHELQAQHAAEKQALQDEIRRLKDSQAVVLQALHDADKQALQDDIRRLKRNQSTALSAAQDEIRWLKEHQTAAVQQGVALEKAKFTANLAAPTSETTGPLLSSPDLALVELVVEEANSRLALLEADYRRVLTEKTRLEACLPRDASGKPEQSLMELVLELTAQKHSLETELEKSKQASQAQSEEPHEMFALILELTNKLSTAEEEKAAGAREVEELETELQQALLAKTQLNQRAHALEASLETMRGGSDNEIIQRLEKLNQALQAELSTRDAESSRSASNANSMAQQLEQAKEEGKKAEVPTHPTLCLSHCLASPHLPRDDLQLFAAELQRQLAESQRKTRKCASPPSLHSCARIRIRMTACCCPLLLTSAAPVSGLQSQGLSGASHVALARLAHARISPRARIAGPRTGFCAQSDPAAASPRESDVPRTD